MLNEGNVNVKGNTNLPYVYFIINKTTGLKYIGSKYSKNCDSRDFWITYFTSSRSVKYLIKKYGKKDFDFKILNSHL